MLLTSHDALEIEALCRDVRVLHEGRVAHQGPVDALGTGAAFQAALSRLLQGEAPHGRAFPSAPAERTP